MEVWYGTGFTPNARISAKHSSKILNRALKPKVVSSECPKRKRLEQLTGTESYFRRDYEKLTMRWID